MARKPKPVKPVSRQYLFDKIVALNNEVEMLRHNNVQATVKKEESERGANNARRRADEAERRLDNLYRQAVPSQTRRVVRTIVIEGDPVWVAKTLATSLQDGRTAVGLLPGGGVQNALTCTTLEDVTVRQDQLRYPDRNRMHDEQYAGTGGHVKDMGVMAKRAEEAQD